MPQRNKRKEAAPLCATGSLFLSCYQGACPQDGSVVLGQRREEYLLLVSVYRYQVFVVTLCNSRHQYVFCFGKSAEQYYCLRGEESREVGESLTEQFACLFEYLDRDPVAAKGLFVNDFCRYIFGIVPA